MHYGESNRIIFAKTLFRITKERMRLLIGTNGIRNGKARELNKTHTPIP